MGSHAGCSSALCHLEVSLNAVALAGMPEEQKANLMNAPLTLSLSIGLNQIELAEHGSQSYRFLPGITSADHNFINITASTIQPPFSKVEARLNQKIGTSSIAFRALNETQENFFPSNGSLSLYLKFELESSIPILLGRQNVFLFNKEPLLYETDVPFNGFPQFNGSPKFLLKNPVELFDESNPDGEPVMTITEGSEITPVNRILYRIHASSPAVDSEGNFSTRATVELVQSVGVVQTAILLIPTRGVTISSSLLQNIALGESPFEFDIIGHIDNPLEEHLEVTIRPYSMEPELAGAARLDVPLPSQAPLSRLDVDHPSILRVRSGETVELGVTPRFSFRESQPEFIWVAPHGMELQNPNSLNPTFVAPMVNELTDIWFTLYVREQNDVSRPYKIDVELEP
ncbi:hypothetical protein [Microseira wollei]|uniref:Uncharacterized protein n=1 Tax=Microseira wollei NIES-4236 TaxID=2530354 RepID=A0AAV3XKC6_9CYAN|nr:hypothetical protein [Microseira wollei]GET41971.1 hypothetical protein MiSe_67850 [Microseira wollei NIES-4236]